MLGKIQTTFGLGLLWLFLFSIPVGQGKNLFQVAHFYVVDTGPVHWVTEKVTGVFDATKFAAGQKADSIVGGVDEQYAKAKKNIQQTME